MSTKPLKRRSLASHVRKSDIRVLSIDQAEYAAQNAFVPAQSTGSGDANDLCYQRLKTWMHVVGDYLEYFRSMAAAELDLATVYARIGDILKVPLPESAMVLPANSDGIQSVTWKLKAFQQLMVESHCAISQTTKSDTLAELACLSEEVKKVLDSYVASIHPVHEALEQCKLNIIKRSELLEIAIAAAKDPLQRCKETVKDPFIINLEVEALLRKRAELENRLYASSVAQQIQIKEFECRFTERLSVAVSSFMDLVSARHKRLRQCAKNNVRSLGTFDAAVEWSHFSTEFESVLEKPQSTHGNANAGDYAYPSKDSDWVRVLRQGVVALKEQGPLFRSTWQSKYGVLTTRGYFHVFRSQGDVVRGAPETSVFLPRARIAMVRSGTLQISSGSRFNRCRIIIQDGTASLDNWRLLMESACYRNSDHMRYSMEPGLATPESSADESSGRVSGKRSSTQRAAAKRSTMTRSSGRLSLDTATKTQGQTAEDLTATPTRRGRPFSVDASMLAQTPLGYGQFGRPVSFTPTQDIYLQPLSNITCAANTGTPFNRHSAFIAPDLSPIPNVSDITGLDGYSPDYTDSSGRDDMMLGNASPASSKHGSDDEAFGKPQAVGLNSTNSSASSGVPHQPESLFERSMSQDTESAPIASLPRMHRRGSPDELASAYIESRSKNRYVGNTESDFWLSGSKHFCFTPMRATRSDAGVDQGSHGWDNSSISSSGGAGSSIVNLKHARPYSSSAGYRFSTDIWSSDVLSIPDPAAGRLSSETRRQRPRSMIHQPSSCSDHAALDPTNPYLGEFLARHRKRSTRVDSCTSTVCATQQAALWRSSAQSNMSGSTSNHHRVVSQLASAPGKASPPLQKLLSVGPCPPIAPDSHDSIPEAAYEYDDTCSSPSAAI
ncbi:hypothetical protein IW140_000927 [Coemansia sp. RSA 1813]|nr:hypothetical protein EV178_001352 [Coemansia sp. RSA 1646]KAJ1772896.1 hypothetical protein LPJ74_001034 [Coemansia sp. RSA 1843]KAJ2093468.1 hypothetical protein IW138_000318 [Coemansia sp. RSA 986]KAJ2217277.1 hypothetical protein EV179_000744 [Coemansia sp. RSA 487]KAJ2572476.1 hypothetical protein IW140_000927 [Coemansia sp. RSA 1813]